ncbi:unnamed protein product [Rotaria magnacalcarata]|uniref:Uncharacterized protein n=1 Tax=Rotaria magnacalcarata TaxID=392030 RepID=A0A819A2B1_9BILA|nr:unnamed protein product [Rotaria magnacalcarata]CAF2075025.1 unnamed protein product [Rotaria magnacalcarata]CAF3778516.1 unnamed protein product [Rotaria magnacalcarata]CAF3808042.1 unnamed protein product [Rotaria magnacalcarata]
MKLSLVRLSGGDADVPAHIRQQMATNWYVRHFNSYTTRGRANSVIAVIGGWFLFGYSMSKWSQSRKAKQIASEPAKQAAPALHASSAQKGGHH